MHEWRNSSKIEAIYIIIIIFFHSFFPQLMATCARCKYTDTTSQR